MASYYSSTVLADNPYLYWRLGESAGASSVSDSSGNNRNGIVKTPANAGLGIATSLIASQQDDGAFSGPSSSNPGIYTNESGLNAVVEGALSLECWVQPSGNNTTGLIWGNDQIGRLSWGPTNKVTLARCFNGNAQSTSTSIGTISTSSPTHLVATFLLSGTTLTANLYINGALDSTASSNGVSSLGRTDISRYLAVGCSMTNTLTVGSNPSTQTSIDDVAVYSSELSSTRVLAHYNAGSTALPSNSVAPALTGLVRARQTMTTDNGSWTGSPSSYTYQWQQSDDAVTWTNISGATSSTYTIPDSLTGKYVRSSVNAINLGGDTVAYSAASTQITAAVPEQGLIWHSSATNVSTPTEGLIFWPKKD